MTGYLMRGTATTRLKPRVRLQRGEAGKGTSPAQGRMEQNPEISSRDSKDAQFKAYESLQPMGGGFFGSGPWNSYPYPR